MDPKVTARYIKEVMSVDRDYIAHNAPYDLGWLAHEGIEVAGRVIDTQVIGFLLDENRLSYALDALLRDYLGSRKNERLLRDAANDFGVDAKAELWKLPATYVGGYAEDDAGETLRLYQHFKRLILDEDLNDIFDLETKVQRVAFAMTRRGVPFNEERAFQKKKELKQQEAEKLAYVKSEYGVNLSVWEPNSVAALFDVAGVPYGRTAATNQPSFNKLFLNSQEHPVAKLVVDLREINKAYTTFIDSLMEHNVNGRIHPIYHTTRDDDGGTVTGRFSCSDPNLQQIPARHPIIGPMIRSLFHADFGNGEQWGAFDYSSQEPRLVVHYAALMDYEGAAEFVARYWQDVKTDFHQLAADIMGVSRKKAKDLNLGIFYGMGKNKLAAALGITADEAADIIRLHEQKVPFVRQLSDFTMKRAEARGVIRTLLGRRCRFNLWEPVQWGAGKPKPHAEALQEFGPQIKRAWAYKALNKLIQGSAADQTKRAVVACAEAGHLPHIQIHDELGHPLHSRKQALEIKHIMETCVELKIPSLVDAEIGPSWGEATKGIDDVFKEAA
jgi:DNA polymerase I-like protein with 3'-5' exonuclease and polymerase domains